MAEGTLHTLAVTGVRDENARTAVIEYLEPRLGGKSHEEIATLVNNLPLVITRRATTDTARSICADLETRGAEVSVQPPLPERDVSTVESGLELDMDRMATGPGGGDVIPPGALWERRAQVGFMTALFKSLRAVLFSRKEFFDSMPRAGGLGAPLLFGVIWGTVGVWLGLLYQLLLQGGMMAMQGAGEDAAAGMAMTIGFVVGYGIFAPLLMVMSIFIQAAILHVGVLIVRGAGTFEGTFRTACFSTAGQVWAIIPFIGAFIGAVWSLVLLYTGIQKIHDLTPGKTLLAIFLPLIAVAIVGIVLALIVGSLIGAAGLLGG